MCTFQSLFDRSCGCRLHSFARSITVCITHHPCVAEVGCRLAAALRHAYMTRAVVDICQIWLSWLSFPLPVTGCV